MSKWTECRGDCTVLPLALDVHIGATQGQEVFGMDNYPALVERLKKIIETWQPSVRESDKPFDEAVKRVCEIALEEATRTP